MAKYVLVLSPAEFEDDFKDARYLSISTTKEKNNTKCSEDEKNPLVLSDQVSRDLKLQSHLRHQQQQSNRSSKMFWNNLNQAWQKIPNMPRKGWVSSATEMDGKVYVSVLQENRFRQVAPFMYDINKKQWSPMPLLSRIYFVLVAIHSQKQLLAVAGSFPDNTMSSEVLLWDEGNGEWVTRYPNMPTPRCSVTSICYCSAVIVAGGITCWEPWTLTSTVEVLHINDTSPSDSHWSIVEQLPHVMYSATPKLCNDTLYLSSCTDVYDDRYDNTFTVLATSVPELLNSDTSGKNLWKKLPDAPFASYSINCYQGRLITFTGYHLVEEPDDREQPVHKLVPLIHIFNPDTMSWDCVGYMSCGYALGRSVYIGENRILFMGGVHVVGTYNHYDSDNWIHDNLQLELTPVVHKPHPSIIPY